MAIRTEDEYFAKEDALKLRKLAKEKMKRLAEDERKRLKELHWMHCPKCGYELEQTSYRGVEIDRCFNCGGVWLDQGELEKLTGKESNLIEDILSLLKL